MNDYTLTDTQRDEKLWALAKKRFEFKKHLLIYFAVNAGLWCLWIFSGRSGNSFIPWPAYVTVGWGIGLTFQYITAYSRFKEAMLDKEYEKLKNKL